MFLKNIFRYLLPVWAFMFFVIGNVGAQNTDSLWEKGNTFYEQSQYDNALNCYLQIEEQGYQNADLFYNMGNAYYRLGQTGHAVLYYEKALFKNPTDKRIKENLKIVEEKVELPIMTTPVFFVSWWNSFIVFSPVQMWAWLLFISFLLILYLLFSRIQNKENLQFSGRWLSLALSASVFFGLLFFLSHQARNFSDKAVVLKSNTAFYSAYDSGEHSGLLPEGSVIEIKKQKENRYYSELPNGSTAWIDIKDVRKVQE